MQLASILSDLTSLQVCDPAAALALVSVRASPTSSPSQQQGQEDPSSSAKREHKAIVKNQDPDPDMQRAMQLLDLHENVKMRHVSRRSGGGEHEEGLLRARRDVDRVARALGVDTMQKGMGKGSTG